MTAITEKSSESLSGVALNTVYELSFCSEREREREREREGGGVGEREREMTTTRTLLCTPGRNY